MTWPDPDAYRDNASARFWRAQVLGWLLLAVAGFFIRWSIFGNGVVALTLTLVMEPMAFALTSIAAIWYGRRAFPSSANLLILTCAMLLCVAGAALLASIAYGIHALFAPGPIRITPHSQYHLAFLYYLGMFSIWALAFFGIRSELNARNERMVKMSAQARALRLELEHLQQQIAPHFLFNALNTIVAEIAERPAVAEEMTRHLAAYLRYSLDKGGNGLCSVQEEVAAAEHYMRIQALRFDARFAYRSCIDPCVLQVMLPHMMLQGLVENAIKHGMQTVKGDFPITLRAVRQDETVIIRVEHPGCLLAPGDQARVGGGLANLQRRLEMYYPGSSSFSLRQHDRHVVAEVRLPAGGGRKGDLVPG